MKFLIIGPAWVGDMVMAQTLFKLLKKLYVNAQIDVLAPAWTQPLLDRMPEVNNSIGSPFKHGELRLRQRHSLGVQLRANRYDRAIVLPNSLKSALIPYWARIPRRTGWLGEYRYGLLNDIRTLNKKKFPLMIQRFMALGLEKGAALPTSPEMPQLRVSNESVSKTLAKLKLNPPQKPILALCPGAEFGSSKRWPAEHYAKVANEKITRGWEVWLFGSAKDKSIANQIETLTQQHCINLAGATKLTEAIDLLSLSSMVVTNDSGLMHIAAALNRPLVVIYGSSSPKFTPPLASPSRIQVLSLNLSCSPCFKRECPLKHNKCMKNLHFSRVMAAMETLL